MLHSVGQMRQPKGTRAFRIGSPAQSYKLNNEFRSKVDADKCLQSQCGRYYVHFVNLWLSVCLCCHKNWVLETGSVVRTTTKEAALSTLSPVYLLVNLSLTTMQDGV